MLSQFTGDFERPLAYVTLQRRSPASDDVGHAVALFFVPGQPALLTERLQAVWFVTVEQIA